MCALEGGMRAVPPSTGIVVGPGTEQVGTTPPLLPASPPLLLLLPPPLLLLPPPLPLLLPPLLLLLLALASGGLLISVVQPAPAADTAAAAAPIVKTEATERYTPRDRNVGFMMAILLARDYGPPSAAPPSPPFVR